MALYHVTYLANNASDFAGAVNNLAGYPAGTTSMNVDGLTAAAITYYAGTTFQITGDPTTYKITSDVTSSAGGAITGLPFWPPLPLDIADNTVVTLTIPEVPVSDYDSILFRTSGVNGTITPEGTIDGTNWFGVAIVPVTSTTLATTLNADGVWRIDTRNLRKVRLRVSTPGTASTTTVYWAS